MKRRWSGCAAAICVVVGVLQADAQVVNVEDHPHCIGRVAPDAFMRMPVLVATVPLDSSADVISRHVELLGESVAIALRRMTGGTPAIAPEADSLLEWHELGSVILVVATDGSFSWKPDTTRLESLRANRGVRLLERALDAVRAAGEIVFVPENAIVSAAELRLALVAPEPLPEFAAAGLVRYRGSIAFTLSIPKLTPALVRSIPPPRYPSGAIDGFAAGTLTLQFVVDTLGRAVKESIRDVWPADRPRLTGHLESYYRQFVAAARSAVERGRFTPARIGQCSIPQLLVQPFSFKLQ